MVVVPAEPKPKACDAVVLEPNDPKEKPGVSYRKKQNKRRKIRLVLVIVIFRHNNFHKTLIVSS